MKKNILIMMAAVLITSTQVRADFTDTTAPAMSAVITVEKAKTSPDDTWVTLTGKIVKKISKDEYIFQDSTGEIQVEIKRKLWKGIEAAPDTVLKINGEVDKDRGEVIEINVKSIEIVPAPGK